MTKKCSKCGKTKCKHFTKPKQRTSAKWCVCGLKKRSPGHEEGQHHIAKSVGVE